MPLRKPARQPRAPNKPQIRVTCHSEQLVAGPDLDALRIALNERRGALLSSSFEYPGRYTRWDLGFCDPMLVIEGRARSFKVEALNARGRVLLPTIQAALNEAADIERCTRTGDNLTLTIAAPCEELSEEQRTRRASPMSLIRAVRDLFATPDDPVLAANSHGRPCGGSAARGLRRAGRVHDPPVGRHGHRCSQAGSHAVHRGS